ncbi:MAG: extracellular solute-binding protein, partial [Chloroflexota bacterium]
LMNSSTQAGVEPPAPAEPPVVVVATPQPDLPVGVGKIDFYFIPLSTEEELAMETLARAFNEAYPDSFVNVRTNYNLRDDLNFAKGFAEQFDCYTWYSPYWDDPTQAEYMLDLNSFFDSAPAEFSQDFYPAQLNAYRYEGVYYGVPAVSQPEVMYYNADLLERRGLPLPSNDWTFDQFLEMARAAASTDPQDSSYGYLYDEWEDLIFEGLQIPWAEMEDFTEPQANFNGPDTLAHLNWLVEQENNHVIFLRYDTSWSSTQRALAAGEIAFWPGKAGDPFADYSAEAIEPGYRVGVAPMPRVQGESVGYSINRGYFISPEGQNPQLCWDWITFLSAQPNAMSGIPARRSVGESAAWEARVGPAEAAVYRTALEIYEENPYNLIGGPYYTWRHDAVAAALRGDEIEPFLAILQRKADEYLTCILAVDRAQLAYNELQDEVLGCAKKADPQGKYWP